MEYTYTHTTYKLLEKISVSRSTVGIKNFIVILYTIKRHLEIKITNDDNAISGSIKNMKYMLII